MFDHGFPTDWSTLKKLIWLKGAGIIGGASAIWKTVTGTLIHITDAIASPVKELSVAIEPLQSGSGDPSPTNIRPITGWTGCNVYVVGTNLLDRSKETTGFRLNPDGTLRSDSNKSTSGFIAVLPNIKLYFKNLIGASVAYALCEYDATKTFIRYQTISGSGSVSAEKTLASNTAFIRVSYYSNNTEVAVNYPSTETSYKPYSGTTYSVTFPNSAGTVYGGTLDVVNGGITNKFVSVDLGTLTWSKDTVSDHTVFTASPSPTKAANFNFFCSQYKVVEKKRTQLLDLEIGVSNTNSSGYKAVSIRDDRYMQSTVSDFKTAMSGVQLVYEIATPVDHSVEPISVSTLAGENNIWTDVNGEITLTYQAVPETAFSDNADTGMADFMTLTE